ncbi:MAG TPA: phosphoglycolate phosphatase [Gammaproteobacteria bacterium]|nr:phosphoglycolate phosphatase [Gammaproteobacteria bacterium]
MNPRLVLFDLDGTLADTAADITRATNRVLAEVERPPLPLATVRALVSKGARAVLRAGFDVPPDPAALDALAQRLFEVYCEAPVVDTRPFPGLRGVIADLGEAGLMWGVVTNKPIRLADPIVAALALQPAPRLVIGGDSLARRKPDPLPLLAACERAGVAIAESIYVGDAEIDVQTARAAGMPVVIAGFGYALPHDANWDPAPDFYARSVDELASILLAPVSSTGS